MAVKTTRVLSCDAGCGAEFQIQAAYADEWSVAAAEAGWHQFRVTYRHRGVQQRSKDVYVCPGCPPRTAADKVRAALAADEERRRCEDEGRWRAYQDIAAYGEQRRLEQGPEIDELGLSTRTYGGLRREGIHLLSELTERTAQDLLDIRNFGQGCLAEARKALAEHGLALRGDEEPVHDPAA